MLCLAAGCDDLVSEQVSFKNNCATRIVYTMTDPNIARVLVHSCNRRANKEDLICCETRTRKRDPTASSSGLFLPVPSGGVLLPVCVVVSF